MSLAPKKGRFQIFHSLPLNTSLYTLRAKKYTSDKLKHQIEALYRQNIEPLLHFLGHFNEMLKASTGSQNSKKNLLSSSIQSVVNTLGNRAVCLKRHFDTFRGLANGKITNYEFIDVILKENNPKIGESLYSLIKKAELSLMPKNESRNLFSSDTSLEALLLTEFNKPSGVKDVVDPFNPYEGTGIDPESLYSGIIYS